MPTAVASCHRPHVVTDGPKRTVQPDLLDLARRPWPLRVAATSVIVRPSSFRDIGAVARMHRRCSPRSLLDRYQAGGRPPAAASLDEALRNPLSFVVATVDGDVIATAHARRDPHHGHLCAETAVLVEDAWQRHGIGGELLTHLAGAAQAAGFSELIAYPATAVHAAQRLLVEVGRTRMVPDANPHLHTYLPDGASLGLGSVRQRLAG